VKEFVRHATEKWHKIVSAPPIEEVVWLSPITSYTLRTTKEKGARLYVLGREH